ncbi:hypothetical protein Tco_0654993 [Tanacetum coccineum]|uniref:Uncharacterized protein n=1 Tax=Tanacetum coccineum TaxID=301880 RepID=A0ABQ4X4T5_9ASTR
MGCGIRRTPAVETKSFADDDYAGVMTQGRSTSGSAQFLGSACLLVFPKKQKVSISTTEAEYQCPSSDLRRPYDESASPTLLPMLGVKQRSPEYSQGILLASPKQTVFGKDKSNPLIVYSKLYGYQFTMFYYEELAIPGQMATGKESSNPFMAGSLPKTIHFCDSLPSDEDKSLAEDASKQRRIDDAEAEVTFIDEPSNDARNKNNNNNKISNNN